VVPCTYTGIKWIPFGRNEPVHDMQLYRFQSFVSDFENGSVEAHNAITVYVLQRVSTLLALGGGMDPRRPHRGQQPHDKLVNFPDEWKTRG
jgi:hypothetical protein